MSLKKDLFENFIVEGVRRIFSCVKISVLWFFIGEILFSSPLLADPTGYPTVALTHIDTISVYCDRIRSNTLEVDFLNIELPMLLMAAIWIPPSVKGADSGIKYTEDLIQCAIKKISGHKNIVIVKTPQQAKTAISQKKTGIIFSLEGGEPIEDINNIPLIKSLGIRAVSLTWSRDNSLASAHNTKDDRGLSDKGKEVIRLLNHNKIMIDVSHASDKTIDDILKVSEAPIFASHSNSRRLCNSKRNLTDRQIKDIAQKGGIIGISFHSPHLSCRKESSIEDVYKHIDHIREIGGIEAIAIGSDFDGNISAPNDLQYISDISNLVKKLKSENWTDEQIESILYRNFMRFFEEVFKE